MGNQLVRTVNWSAGEEIMKDDVLVSDKFKVVNLVSHIDTTNGIIWLQPKRGDNVGVGVRNLEGFTVLRINKDLIGN